MALDKECFQPTTPTPNPIFFQDCKNLVSHPSFHGGSIETTDSNNIIELNNFSEFGPKAVSGYYGSQESSELGLGLWSHAYPSQGSLAGLELLAMQGSMGPAGSINNSVYVNPFDPGRDGRRRRGVASRRSRSTELAELETADREVDMEDRQPKHRRARLLQVILVIPTFG